MVRNRVATAAMMPVIQVVMLPMTVGRSATARGIGSAAYAAAAAVATVALAAMVITARRMRLRYMGAHTSRPSGWGMCEWMGGVTAERGGAVGALLLHRSEWVGEHGHLSAGPALAPVARGTASDPAVVRRVCGDSLPTKGSGWVPNSAPAPAAAPNRHPTDPTGTHGAVRAGGRRRPPGSPGYRRDDGRGPGCGR